MTPPSADLFGRTLRSLLWQLLGVGGQRVVQMVGLVVLWRLLAREDLGLFAVVLSGIGVIESLTTFTGEQTSIYSDRGHDRRYLDTVFTVRVLRSLLISGVLVPLAWPLAWFFGDPETDARYWVPGLFLLLAANGLVDAVQSPARAARMKGLDFRRVATGDFVSALAGMGLTLLLAWIRRDVWALVIGHMASTAARTTASYVVAPHRPRFRFDRDALRELFHYNLGAAGTPFLLLMIFTSGPLVLGKIIGKGAVALFDGAGRLAKLPEDVFLRVLAPVAMPAYAELKNERERLARAWIGAVEAFLLVGAPMTVALAWCGEALPREVFGAGYEPVPGLFALLSVHGGLAGLTAVTGPLFWATGKPQWDRRAQFLRALVVYGGGIPAAFYGGVVGFAGATCLAILTALVSALRSALGYLSLGPTDLFQAMRGGLGTALGLLVVLGFVEFCFAPTGWWRIGTAGLLAAPVLATLLARLLRRRSSRDRPTEPTPPPTPDPTESLLP